MLIENHVGQGARVGAGHGGHALVPVLAGLGPKLFREISHQRLICNRVHLNLFGRQ